VAGQGVRLRLTDAATVLDRTGKGFGWRVEGPPTSPPRGSPAPALRAQGCA
jgi:hypothetical protein